MLTQRTRHGLSDVTLQGKDILGTDKLGTGKILDFLLNLSLIPSRTVPLYVSWPFFSSLGAPSTITVTCGITCLRPVPPTVAAQRWRGVFSLDPWGLAVSCSSHLPSG